MNETTAPGSPFRRGARRGQPCRKSSGKGQSGQEQRLGRNFDLAANSPRPGTCLMGEKSRENQLVKLHAEAEDYEQGSFEWMG